MTNWNGTIAASADDAREDAGTPVVTGANVTIDATNRYGGLRFQGVPAAQGDTIEAGTYLAVYVPSLTYDSPDVTLWGQAIDDAPAFTTAANNISGRTATAETVVWTATDIGTGVKNSPELAAIIQEIVNRPGWAAGNDIVLVLKGNSVSPFRFDAYDGGAGVYATLYVVYSTPAAGGGGARVMAMAPGLLVISAGGAGVQSVAM